MDEYKIFLSEPAERDLQEIFFHVSSQLLAPITAESMMDEFHKAMSSLNIMPKRNPLVADALLASLGYRIMPAKNYLIFYSVDDSPVREVNIERVLYNSRDWQSILNL